MVGGAPFLPGDSQAFRSTPSRGNLSHPSSLGAPPVANPSDMCIGKLEKRNPLSSPPFLYTPTHPIFI